VNPVFVDTFYWIALLHRKDAGHKAVLEYSRAFTSTFVTTDEVLTEVLAFTSSDLALRREASRAVRHIVTAGNVRVLPQSRGSFLDGLSLRGTPR
jgi:predicted nucleic acid-binding protein